MILFNVIVIFTLVKNLSLAQKKSKFCLFFFPLRFVLTVINIFGRFGQYSSQQTFEEFCTD